MIRCTSVAGEGEADEVDEREGGRVARYKR